MNGTRTWTSTQVEEESTGSTSCEHAGAKVKFIPSILPKPLIGVTLHPLLNGSMTP